MPKAGDRLDDKYQLLHLIGAGGMGSVWKARHERLGRACAVKFLDAWEGSQNDKRAQRFVREAQLAALVQHSNVVSIFDFGQTPTGELYMVMEMLEGRSLAKRLEHGPPLSLPRLCDLIAQVLTGLGAIHEKGIVHRDLKPENVFLVETGPDVLVKVLDFGISRTVFAQPGAGPKTGPGFTMGTPRFMSPEQVRGAEQLDGRSDLYTLGTLLYRAAAGAYPFDDEDLQRLFVRVVTEDPVPVVKRRPEVGRPFSEVVDRALARDPNDRFASAADFRIALQAAAETIPPGLPCLWGGGRDATDSQGGFSPESAASPHLSAPQRLRRRWRRLVPLGVLLLVALLGWALAG